MAILRFYSSDAFHSSRLQQTLRSLQHVNSSISGLKAEYCFHVEVAADHFDDSKVEILQWILKEPQQQHGLARESVWKAVDGQNDFVIEIGPR